MSVTSAAGTALVIAVEVTLPASESASARISGATRSASPEPTFRSGTRIVTFFSSELTLGRLAPIALSRAIGSGTSARAARMFAWT